MTVPIVVAIGETADGEPPIRESGGIPVAIYADDPMFAFPGNGRS
jgi:hypothetical protein